MTPSLSPEALAKGLTKAQADILSVMSDDAIEGEVLLDYTARDTARLRKLGLLNLTSSDDVTEYHELTDLGRAVARALMEGKGDE